MLGFTLWWLGMLASECMLVGDPYYVMESVIVAWSESYYVMEHVYWCMIGVLLYTAWSMAVSLSFTELMVDPQWLELLIECVATDFVLVLLPFLWCFLFR